MGFGRSFPMGWGILRRVWHLLISLKLAVILLLAILVVAFLRTLFPQLPPGVAADPDTQSLWLAMAQEKYGLLFSPLHTLGLFNLFYSLWFRLLLSLLIINVTICTINRIRSTWRVVFKPKVRVSDALFQKGTLRASLRLAMRRPCWP